MESLPDHAAYLRVRPESGLRGCVRNTRPQQGQQDLGVLTERSQFAHFLMSDSAFHLSWYEPNRQCFLHMRLQKRQCCRRFRIATVLNTSGPALQRSHIHPYGAAVQVYRTAGEQPFQVFACKSVRHAVRFGAPDYGVCIQYSPALPYPAKQPVLVCRIARRALLYYPRCVALAAYFGILHVTAYGISIMRPCMAAAADAVLHWSGHVWQACMA